VKICTGFLTLAAATGVCWGQGEGSEIIERVFAHYKGLEGCSLTLSLDIESDNEMMKGMGQTSHGSVLKPNILAFWPEEAGGGMGMPSPQVYADGKQMLSALPDGGIYSVEDAPASFGDLLGEEDKDAGPRMPTAVWQMVPGVNMVLQLMSDEPEERFGKMLTGAEYKGTQGEDLDSHHVFIATEDSPTGEDVTMEVHVAAVGDPWVVAVLPQAQVGGGGMAGEIKVVLRFEDWEAVDAVPAAGRLEVAEDWEEVDDLMAEVMGGMMQMGAGEMEGDFEGADLDFEMPAGPGEGAEAADFTLDTLDDASFSLAEHEGKVVVLDFWATWCAPCIQGLPVVSAVTAEYADKGVVFAAVDLAEKADHVAEFMEKKEWDFTVALDTEGKVSDSYGVSGIPHSVVIDKQGVIRHVHIGFGGAKQYEKQLRKELEELLAE
jgi:thiol-disulfide isomerase/thioredoxin